MEECEDSGPLDGARASPVTEMESETVLIGDCMQSAEEALQHEWIIKDETMRRLAARLMGMLGLQMIRM